MSGWEIKVEAPYTVVGNEEIPYDHYPQGCFNGPFDHFFNDNGELFLKHSKGDTRLSGGWSGLTLVDFRVIRLAPCCPEGWMRCKNPDGTYCCLPCEEIKNAIANITSTLKEKNKNG